MLRYLWIPALIWLASCSAGKEVVRSVPPEFNPDSVGYELIVMEPGYDSWMATNRKPAWYYSKWYYENWNRLYVNEWNYRVRTMGYVLPYDFLINYEPGIDYGPEVEYRLYWYFKFMEQKYGIDLLAGDQL